MVPRSKWALGILDGKSTIIMIAISNVDRCVALNATSLAFGILGNFFLLCNFTRLVRYIIALPLSIFLWMVSTVIVGLTYIFAEAKTDVYS